MIAACSDRLLRCSPSFRFPALPASLSCFWLRIVVDLAKSGTARVRKKAPSLSTHALRRPRVNHAKGINYPPLSRAKSNSLFPQYLFPHCSVKLEAMGELAGVDISNVHTNVNPLAKVNVPVGLSLATSNTTRQGKRVPINTPPLSSES